MKLCDYLDAHKITLEAFAATIGRTKATVSRIANEVNRPDNETMQAIIDATDGAVTPNDFFGIGDDKPDDARQGAA